MAGDLKPGDWSISVRSGDGAAQQDSTGPVFGLRPFSSFAPGETVVDVYDLGAAGSVDEIWLILYRPQDGGFENLAEIRLSD